MPTHHNEIVADPSRDARGIRHDSAEWEATYALFSRGSRFGLRGTIVG